MEKRAEIIVVGAGHAGVEAALACARTGHDTVLFTIQLDAVGNMPCNPSIGGTGKGHLVYEIDALGGEMGRGADAVTLQSRTLNAGRGFAVHSRRIQADRAAYRHYMKGVLERTPRLRLVQSMVVEVLTEEREGMRHVTGVKTHLGEVWHCDAVIICAGTFLNATVFVGDNAHEAGPDGMLPAKGLTEQLASLGISLRRFKTGTPARVHRRSVDLSRLEEQQGDVPAVPFSADTDPVAFAAREQLPCYIVYTNPKTHKVILDNIGRSALYSGKIHGTGPRYCPSIEDKLVRFADKERHQLFVEPCGKDTEELYLQGFSTSLPTDVQEEMIHSLHGFERAEIMRYAYAIEYDCVDPTELLPTLEFKRVRGLYGAGQFNGTSGYEEAAAQGLVAGINAHLACIKEEPLILPRSSSYIGTLIDDLVTKGTNEPYRMMTSRCEWRLLLRQDNADLRLTEIGHRVGLVTEERYARFLRRREQTEEEVRRLEATTVHPTEEVNALLLSLGTSPIQVGVRMADLLRRPEVSYGALAPVDPDRPTLSPRVALTAEITIKYDGYIKREEQEVERRARLEDLRLPDGIDYLGIRGLRIEAAQKLHAMRPATVGQASRISGVSPADIGVLLIYLGRE
ncbi:MAG: tRNA uridine-5-carboxymethylaminomethyl(34) synthesis enzyme MnmG [Clostridia bacterium]|nr:tRNA uridine-5-carboxymethylaminomethyl(34) synthesis enzyme MnmG [Clostridia bacterium]